MTKDKATYPDNGVIYKGDYLEGIPYGDYIRRMELPSENVYDIRDFGAVPDSGCLATDAFDSAARAAARTNGTVLVAGGSYIVGSIFLYSCTTLFVEYGSALCASKDLTQYSDALLSVRNQHDVTITGGGRLHGNGEFFVNLPKEKPLLKPLGYTKLPPRLLDPLGLPEDTIRYAYRQRIRYADDRWHEGAPNIRRPMYTLWIRNSTNVRIENFILSDSLDWSVDIDCSKQVTVRDMVIDNNRHVANSDGIDVMGSEDVLVEHLFVSTADDGLCVKAPRKQGHDGLNVEHEEMTMGPARNITFRDCTVCSVMNAFKIGTETYYDIEHVRVEGCTFIMPDLHPGGVGGISIESADGSALRNVTIQDIRMENIVCPLFICLNRRNKFGFDSEADEQEKRYGGSIENITIRNVEAVNMEIPCLITGYTDGERTKRVRDITIGRFHARYRDNREILDIRYPLYENIEDYPESNAFGDLPAYGFFVRHADEIRMEDVSVIPRSANTREEFVFEDAVRC